MKNQLVPIRMQLSDNKIFSYRKGEKIKPSQLLALLCWYISTPLVKVEAGQTQLTAEFYSDIRSDLALLPNVIQEL